MCVLGSVEQPLTKQACGCTSRAVGTTSGAPRLNDVSWPLRANEVIFVDGGDNYRRLIAGNFLVRRVDGKDVATDTADMEKSLVVLVGVEADTVRVRQLGHPLTSRRASRSSEFQRGEFGEAGPPGVPRGAGQAIRGIS